MACKTNEVIPKFLQIKEQVFAKGMDKIIRTAQMKMLKTTIRNLRKDINYIEVKCYYFYDELATWLDPIIFRHLLLKLHDKIEQQKRKTKITHNKKLQMLIEKQRQQRSKDNNVSATPILNISKCEFTTAELNILNKGPNYAAPTTFSIPNIIPTIENAVKCFPYEYQCEMRNKFVFAINKHNNLLNNQPKVNNKYFDVVKKIKNNENIRFIRADKTNQLVAIDCDKFDDKFNSMISELNCSILDKDPTDQLITKINNFARDSQKTNPPAPFKFKVPFYPAPPKLFVKIKTHKLDMPLRPIVAKYTAPTFILESKLNKFLTPLISQCSTNTKSALHLIEDTKNLSIPKTAFLASFDVKSLYPNIPTDRALDLIVKRAENFPEIKPHKKFIIKSLKIIFAATYFIFNSIIYFQKTGSPMGSALSVTLSDVILQEVQTQALKNSLYTPFFFRRYIDDYFIIWDKGINEMYNFLNCLNNVYPSIKLTCEIEQNKSIAFLDIKITRGYNDKLYFNVYRKSTYIPTPIPVDSEHPMSSKKAYFRAHILRARTHTTFSFQENTELNWIRKIAKQAGYTNKWINNLIKHTLSPPHKISSLSTQKANKPATCKYATPIPFSEQFYSIQKYASRKFNINIPFMQTRDTSKLIVNDKDKNFSSGGIYCINFNNPIDNTTKTYIGQTCRKLSARINEHIKGKDNQYCGTAVKQFMKSNPEYIPDWENVRILAAPRDHDSLLMREAIEIFRNSEDCINGKDGTKIPEIWQHILRNSN